MNFNSEKNNFDSNLPVLILLHRFGWTFHHRWRCFLALVCYQLLVFLHEVVVALLLLDDFRMVQIVLLLEVDDLQVEDVNSVLGAFGALGQRDFLLLLKGRVLLNLLLILLGRVVEKFQFRREGFNFLFQVIYFVRKLFFIGVLEREGNNNTKAENFLPNELQNAKSTSGPLTHSSMLAFFWPSFFCSTSR